MKSKKSPLMNRFSRRKFLLGAGGAALAIPLLPSLFPKEAIAAPGDIKRFVAIGTKHGGVWYENQYPNDALLTNSQSYRGQTIQQGALASSVVGADRVISEVLQGPSSLLTEALISKMNVIRGIDVPYYIAHHRGGHLGNFADNDANGAHGAFMQSYATGTIDQFLANSSQFYPDLTNIVRKSVHLGFGGMSHTAENGEVRALETSRSSLQLFDEIFRPTDSGIDRSIIDDVNENYKRMLRRSLSAEDRSRLVLHVEMIDELERKINVVRECSFNRPGDDANQHLEDDPVDDRVHWQLMNDVIVAGFACDTFRIVTMGLNDHFTNYSGDWHQGNAHEAHTAAIQPVLVNSHRNVFKDVFLDLAAKLDAISDDQSTTVLDNTLMHWSHESGPKTHDSFGVPIVTAGGLNGTLSTGNYIDYSNRQNDVSDQGVQQHQGLLYNQWLANVLIGMDESPQDFEGGALNQSGWGPSYIGYEEIYAAAVRNNLSEKLPYLFA